MMDYETRWVMQSPYRPPYRPPTKCEAIVGVSTLVILLFMFVATIGIPVFFAIRNSDRKDAETRMKIEAGLEQRYDEQGREVWVKPESKP